MSSTAQLATVNTLLTQLYRENLTAHHRAVLHTVTKVELVCGGIALRAPAGPLYRYLNVVFIDKLKELSSDSTKAQELKDFARGVIDFVLNLPQHFTFTWFVHEKLKGIDLFQYYLGKTYRDQNGVHQIREAFSVVDNGRVAVVVQAFPIPNTDQLTYASPQALHNEFALGVHAVPLCLILSVAGKIPHLVTLLLQRARYNYALDDLKEPKPESKTNGT